MGSSGGMGSMMGGDMGMAGGSAAMGEGTMGGGMSPFGGPLSAEPGATTLSLVLMIERADGPPASGCLVGLLDDGQKSLPIYFPQVAYGGEAMEGGMSSMGGFFGAPMGQPSLQTAPGLLGATLQPHSQGQVQAGRIDPGRYTAVVEFPSGWYTHHKFVVKPGEQHVEKIICPKPTEKAFVTITAPPLPEDLRKMTRAILKARVTMQPNPLGRVIWRRINTGPSVVHFDTETGHPCKLLTLRPQSGFFGGSVGILLRDGVNYEVGTETDLRNDPPEDRFIVLSTGEYQVSLVFQSEEATPLDVLEPRSTLAELTYASEQQRFVVQPGQNTWTLDRAADLFDAARSKLTELKENAAKDGAP
jgi:hypothetical protein